MMRPIKPNRYIAQSGTVCWVGGEGGGSGGGGDWAGSVSDAGDWVVKALTALQAL